MSSSQKLTCIVCPTGCQMEVTFEDGHLIRVTGNTCSRGKDYATSECTHPTRTLTTTVRIMGGEIPLLPVKTQTPVEKHLIMNVMEVLNKVVVNAPVRLGQVIVPDILGSGVNVVATRPVEQAKSVPGNGG